MRTLRLFLVLLLLQTCCVICAQRASYVVYDASPGVVLHSSKSGQDIKNLLIGEEVFNKDLFIINDIRYNVKLKDVSNGEIFSLSGEKGRFSPKQIVSRQRRDLFSKFLSYFKIILKDMGFTNAPVTNFQCVRHKGATKKEHHYSDSIALQIEKIIEDSLYYNKVSVKKKYIEKNTSFNYSVENIDSIDYEFCLYTVSSDGSVNSHSKVVIEPEEGQMRSGEIVFIPLFRNTTVDLSYFTMASNGENSHRTCYVILFKPNTIYKKTKRNKYDTDVQWDMVAKKLKYQGDTDRVIYVK